MAIETNIEFLLALQYVQQASAEAQEFLKEYSAESVIDTHTKVEIEKAVLALNLLSSIATSLNELNMETQDMLEELRAKINQIASE